MRVHYGFENLPEISNATVAIGSFDGVHHGHRLLIGELHELARCNGGESVIITFDPHPRQILRGENRLLSTIDEKLLLLSETEVDHVIVVNFTLQFSRLSHHQFIEEYIIGKLHTKALIAGENHHFGHNKSGDAKSLKEYGIQSHNLIRYDNISSTQIRTEIEKGNMSEASKLLGSRGYLVQTPVRDSSKLLPTHGYYSVEIDGITQTMEVGTQIMSVNHGNVIILAEI